MIIVVTLMYGVPFAHQVVIMNPQGPFLEGAMPTVVAAIFILSIRVSDWFHRTDEHILIEFLKLDLRGLFQASSLMTLTQTNHLEVSFEYSRLLLSQQSTNRYC